MPERKIQPDDQSIKRRGFRTIKIVVEGSVFDLWEAWLFRVRKIHGAQQTEAKAIEFALIEALNTPEDSIK